MLTKKLACPSCHVNLKVADTLPPGKVIKCPKCGKSFPVPDESVEFRAPLPDSEDGTVPFKVEAQAVSAEKAEERPAKTKGVAKSRRMAPPRGNDDEVDEEPKARRVHAKRRKRPKKASNNTPIVLSLVIAGAVLIVGGGVALLFVFKPFSNKNAPVAASNPSPPQPSAAGPSGARRGPERARPDAGNQEPADSGRDAGPPASRTVPVATQADRSSAAVASFRANCARCHSAGGDSPGGGRGGRGQGPNLSRVGAKRTADWLLDHIRNPTVHNPSSRMPSFEGKISEDELRSLAEYLAGLKG
jgi:mono/diheme cytochrome c family protein